MVKITEHHDLAGNVIRVGDCIAFVSGGHKRAAHLGIARVVRLTRKGVVIREASHVDYMWDSEKNVKITVDKWVLSMSEMNVIGTHKFLLITMASLPKEAFVMFDQLEIK